MRQLVQSSSDSLLACDSCQLGAPPASPSPHLWGAPCRLPPPGQLIDKEIGAKWRVGLSVPTDNRSSANDGIVNPRLWGHSFAIYHADSITPSEVVTGPPTQHLPSLRVPVIVLASPHLAFQRNGALLLGHSYSSGPKASPTRAADLAIFLKILPAQHPATGIRSSASVFLVLVSFSYRTPAHAHSL